MGIIDSFYKHFLVLPRVYTPCSSNDANITFSDSISGNFKWSKTVLNLTYWIKLIHLCALYGRFSRDITLRKSFIGRAVYTLSGTSPKLCEKRYYRNSWERTDSSLPQNLPYSRVIYIGLIRNPLSIKFEYFYRTHIFDLTPIFCKEHIFHLLIISLSRKSWIWKEGWDEFIEKCGLHEKRFF